MFYGEFGRQLKANGDGGTDHGRGNFIILVGGKVTGGIYGTLFPNKDKDNFDRSNRDIETTTAGTFTSFDPIYDRIATWMNNGTPLSLSLNGESNVDTSGGITSLAGLLT
jgi:uncharacterized protein (DUF1501 family)